MNNSSEQDPPAPYNHETQTSPKNTSKPKEEHLVLILDDEPEIAELYMLTLAPLGFNIVTLFDSAEALVWLETHEPDLILLDMSMPDISGAEVVYYLRGEERLKETKVIIVTGHQRNAEEVADQVELVLIKPTKLEDLRTFALRLTSP